MKITNTDNLPEPLVAAVSRVREPSPDRVSVTELIGPPQIRQLSLRHWDEIVEDASERIWATMGTLMHQLLESHAGVERHLAERTLTTTVAGFTVTGTFDLYHEGGVLSDYKFVSVWTTLDGLRADWVSQLNLYAYLLRLSGSRVSRLQIVAIYRDWSKGRAHDQGYPQSQVQIFEVPLWTDDRALAFLEERLRLHAAAQGGAAVECTPDERWERPTKYALRKRGQKRAVKLFDDYAEARGAASSPNLYVERRPGASVRCESYCRVAAFCPQYARLRAGSAEEGGGE